MLYGILPTTTRTFGPFFRPVRTDVYVRAFFVYLYCAVVKAVTAWVYTAAQFGYTVPFMSVLHALKYGTEDKLKYKQYRN